MIVLRDPKAVVNISDPDIRNLVAQRFAELWPDEDYDPNLHGYMIVVEPGDTVDAIEAECKCRIWRTHSGDVRVGVYETSFEFVEEHTTCYEMAFVLSDDGYGIELFIPKVAGVDSTLLALCAQYATPALTAESSE